MNKLEPKILKGFRDFLPNEARKRQYVINTLKSVFELYGFEPLETPALEYEEILTGKYGDEGDKLMYRFEDNGKRRVALRYDQTVPLSRVIAQYKNELTFPFKRYQIQPVWRAENTQKGRFREFVQCDIDTVGSLSPLSDAEILNLVYKAYIKLGVDIEIKINDRNLLSTISPNALGVLPILDKLNKIGEEGVIKELEETGLSNSEAKKLLYDAKALKASVELKNIEKLAIELGCPTDSIKFEPTLARGLDYYTGVIMEVFLKNSDSKLSLGSGGRYDNLIGMFAGREIPAVGFAFGFDRLLEAMEQLKLFPSNLQTAKVLVTIFSPELKDKSIEIASRLRDAPFGKSQGSNNINTELYLDENAKMEKQLKYANQKGIPYVIIIGPDEMAKDVVQLKNMETREQKEVSIEELIKTLITS